METLAVQPGAAANSHPSLRVGCLRLSFIVGHEICFRSHFDFPFLFFAIVALYFGAFSPMRLFFSDLIRDPRCSFSREDVHCDFGHDMPNPALQSTTTRDYVACGVTELYRWMQK